jgi:hypothetical protein
VHYLDLVEVLFTWLVAQSVAAATARSNGALSDEGTLTGARDGLPCLQSCATARLFAARCVPLSLFIYRVQAMS